MASSTGSFRADCQGGASAAAGCHRSRRVADRAAATMGGGENARAAEASGDRLLHTVGVNSIAAQAISTERLELLPLRVDHAEEMAVVPSDPALHTFIGGAPDTEQALRARYERMTAGSPDPAVAWLNWVIRLREEDCLTGGSRRPSAHPESSQAPRSPGWWGQRGRAEASPSRPYEDSSAGSTSSRWRSSRTSTPTTGHRPPSPLPPDSRRPTSGTTARSDGAGPASETNGPGSTDAQTSDASRCRCHIAATMIPTPSTASPMYGVQSSTPHLRYSGAGAS